MFLLNVSYIYHYVNLCEMFNSRFKQEPCYRHETARSRVNFAM